MIVCRQRAAAALWLTALWAQSAGLLLSRGRPSLLASTYSACPTSLARVALAERQREKWRIRALPPRHHESPPFGGSTSVYARVRRAHDSACLLHHVVCRRLRHALESTVLHRCRTKHEHPLAPMARIRWLLHKAVARRVGCAPGLDRPRSGGSGPISLAGAARPREVIL